MSCVMYSAKFMIFLKKWKFRSLTNGRINISWCCTTVFKTNKQNEFFLGNMKSFLKVFTSLKYSSEMELNIYTNGFRFLDFYQQNTMFPFTFYLSKACSNPHLTFIFSIKWIRVVASISFFSNFNIHTIAFTTAFCGISFIQIIQTNILKSKREQMSFKT